MFGTDNAIQRAAAAAQSGNQDEALQILLKLVARDEKNLQAWVLLSQLVDNEEDQLIAIENALVLLPGDEVLMQRRQELFQSHPHLSALSNFPSTGRPHTVLENFERARWLAGDGEKTQAIHLFRAITSKHPGFAPAWIELAHLEPALPERIRAAESALAVDPANSEIKALLDRLREEQKHPFRYGQLLEEQGQFEQAVELYRSVIIHSRLANDRIKAQRRVENIQLRLEAHQAQPVHPNLNLLRLTIGPILLFLMMLFMQSGLKFTHIPFVAFAGIFSVAAGGFLVAVTEMVPAHPAWVKLFGQPGSSDEPETRRGLRMLGWALQFAPYTIFLLEASQRLGELQAAMAPALR